MPSAVRAETKKPITKTAMPSTIGPRPASPQPYPRPSPKPSARPSRTRPRPVRSQPARWASGRTRYQPRVVISLLRAVFSFIRIVAIRSPRSWRSSGASCLRNSWSSSVTRWSGRGVRSAGSGTRRQSVNLSFDELNALRRAPASAPTSGGISSVRSRPRTARSTMPATTSLVPARPSIRVPTCPGEASSGGVNRTATGSLRRGPMLVSCPGAGRRPGVRPT
ncbi:hypothetical protein SDC9_148180 [bioreactor metagenome]|uniref:Uncharacterized protein n=1 Tax=bioreactor metagenome TaxID=1076179 RepID=A0A645EI80_9ZZZZ